MRFFDARDLRDRAETVAISATLGATIIAILDFKDGKLSSLGYVGISLSVILALVALVVRNKENKQMQENEDDLAVGGTD